MRNRSMGRQFSIIADPNIHVQEPVSLIELANDFVELLLEQYYLLAVAGHYNCLLNL